VTDAAPKFVTVGRIVGAWGVKGWVRVRSFTDPPDNIVGFSAWTLCRDGRRSQLRLEEGRLHGRGQIVAKLESIANRDAAAALAGSDVDVARSELGPCEDGEYYWADLEGLEVIAVGGQSFGRIDHLLRTGSNDVLVVRGERERLIPFVDGDVVKTVDIDAGRIVVDWDPEF
jgi:16S rRNA processing protein RimM